MREKKLKYTGLDTLRGFAAISVALYHFLVLGPHSYILKSGHLAVDFFFCLSGFVIAYAYEERLRSGLTVAQFFIMRVIRFYPLYFIGFLLGLVQFGLVYQHIDFTNPLQPDLSTILTAVGLNFLLLPGPGISVDTLQDNFALNFPAWSLFCELVMNVFYAFIVRFLSNRVLAWVIGLFAIAMSIAIGFAGSGVGYTHDTLVGGLLRCGFSFFTGVLLFRFRDAYQIAGPSRWLLALFLFVPFIYQAPELYRAAVDTATITLLFPAIVWLAARPEKNDRGTSWFFRLLGDTSYGLYVVHVPLIYIAIVLWPILGKSMPSAIALGSGMALIGSLVAVVSLLDRYYDRPMRKSLLQHFVPVQRVSTLSASVEVKI